MNNESARPARNHDLKEAGQILQLQVSVFEDLIFLGKRRFTKDKVTIGSSRFADIVLDHKSVADIHAMFYLRKGKVILSNKYPNDGLRLNGQVFKTAVLDPKDVIDIGPYSMQILLGPTSTQTEDKAAASIKSDVDNTQGLTPTVRQHLHNTRLCYDVVLNNHFASEAAREKVAGALASLFRTDPAQIRLLLKKPRHLLKRGLDYPTALRWQKALKDAGAQCVLVVQNEAHQAIESTLPKVQPQQDKSKFADLKSQTLTAATPAVSASTVSDETIADLDEDEDEDDLWIAPFSLKTKIAEAKTSVQTAIVPTWQIEIIKTIGAQVIDVRYLDKGNHYKIRGTEGTFRLAKLKSNHKAFITFPSYFDGLVTTGSQDRTDLEAFKTEQHIYSRRKHLYRIPLPQKGQVELIDGPCRYLIRLTPVSISPAVVVTEQPPLFDWWHWAVSIATHLLLAIIVAIWSFFITIQTEKPEPHFVKIDPSLLQQLKQPKIEKPKPKVKPKIPPPKPKVQKMAKKKIKPKKKVKPKTAKVVPTSKNPKAGGGFGKGNILNRDVNQAGILSVLGSTTTDDTQATLAAVTTLDAVAAPGATEKNFKVQGLKSSLGNGKISVGRTAIVQTKGGKQVLRSAGAGGKGDVAALEKGQTGKGQVKAMVTANLSQKVKIQGGMSREMVKRVIDQHMSEISYCYESALMSNPTIMGRIVFEWKILMNGKVGQIRIIASSINSHDVHACIKSAIKSWQFPKPVGSEVIVSYPFVFDLVAF